MKVIEKSKAGDMNTEIGEAFIEVSADRSEAYLQAVMNDTGEVIRYGKFIKSSSTTSIDVNALNEKVNLIISALSNLSCSYGNCGVIITGPSTTEKINLDTDYTISNASSTLIKK